MSASTDDIYYVGQGSANLATRITAGAINSGYLDVGDIEGCKISFKQTFADVQENTTGYGFNALHAPTSIDADLTLVMRKWNMVNLQRAVWAPAPAAQPGGTVTAEVINGYNGAKTYLANINITSLVLTTTTPATLVLGTDYTVDGSYGSFTILPGSALVPAGGPTVLQAAYTFAASNGKLAAFSGGPVEYSLRVDARNVANPFVDASGSAFAAVQFNVHRVMFDTTKMLDLIGKKDATLELDGKILIDPTIAYVPGSASSVLMDIIKA